MMKLYVSSVNEPKEPSLKISFIIIFTYSIHIVNDNVFDVIQYVHYWCSVLFYQSTITLSMFECGLVLSSSTESFKKKLYSHQPFLQQQTGSPAVIIVTLFTSPHPFIPITFPFLLMTCERGGM